MATNRKYAALPDLVRMIYFSCASSCHVNRVQDSAPDIYETPSLTDDNSTAVVCLSFLLHPDKPNKDPRTLQSVRNRRPRITKTSTMLTPTTVPQSPTPDSIPMQHAAFSSLQGLMPGMSISQTALTARSGHIRAVVVESMF
jgi:hypothetical protein